MSDHTSSETKVERPPVLSPDEARRFFEDGARRWRKPRRAVLNNGLDIDSLDFRGERAAFAVTRTLPPDHDSEGEPILRDPDEVRQHYNLGLVAIQEAGTLPLDERFEEGYKRWAAAVVRETVTFTERAANPEPHPGA